ncbi:MAG: radical SAM protein [Spirochaetes bacterium]|nr:MAG: radical SAM protein [Spirochaetota bacterium]
MGIKNKLKTGAVKIGAKTATKLMTTLSEEKWMKLVHPLIARQKMPEAALMIDLMLRRLHRGFPTLAKNVKERFIQNFIVKPYTTYGPRRKAFYEENGYEVPSLLVISPSMRCNLRCYGCYAWKYKKSDDLDIDVVHRVINEAKEMGIFFFVISGGEPTFWPHLFEVLETHNDAIFQIYTNGTLIDEKMADRFAEVGNALPCISVEGFEKETDERRGKGTFQKISNAMDLLREKGVIFGFSATATRYNNELIVSDEFVDYFIEKGIYIGWYFNYIPIGKDPDLDLMPTPEQRDYRRKRIIELRDKKKAVLADFWNDGILTNGCLAGGYEYMHVIYNGDVEPCVFAHFAADNIKEKSLKEIIESPFFMAFRKRRPYNENLLRPCTIIDNPHILRDAVKEGNAHPTHDGAETIITTIAPKIDEYAKKWGEVADRAWKEEYENKTYKGHLDLVEEVMNPKAAKKKKKIEEKMEVEVK